MIKQRYLITGGTKGLGRALSREFIAKGNDVIVTSRERKQALKSAKEIKKEARLLPKYKGGGKTYGIECDVRDERSVKEMVKRTKRIMKGVDTWICNAGQSGGNKILLEQKEENIKDIIETNLYGTMICTKEALKMFKESGKGMICYVDGAGSDGIATPGYTIYGATKAGVKQFWESIKEEAEEIGVYTHMISPGMVLTPLLLEGVDTEKLGKLFNILCEHPEKPAKYLANKVIQLRNKEEHTYVRYLTKPYICWRFITYPTRRNKYFDEDTGLKLYSDDFMIRMKN